MICNSYSQTGDFLPSLQVVQFLLGHVDKRGVYQALMLAINLGHDEIAEMIIEHPIYEDISAEIKVRVFITKVKVKVFILTPNC